MVTMNRESSPKKAKAELIREDPGKASVLIQKFNTPKNAEAPQKKDRVEGKRFTEDRLNFLNKKADESSNGPTTPVIGVKPGGGDKKWLQKLSEEEAARKDAANSRNAKDDVIQKLEDEIENASKECAERSRLLNGLREKYQTLKDQMNDLQDMLGMANSVRVQLMNNEKRQQRALETDQERKKREAEETEMLKCQAIEMREKLNTLMESDKQRILLQEEMELMKQEFDAKEQQALSELDRLTEFVKSLTEKIDHKDQEWKVCENKMKALLDQLETQKLDMRKKDEEYTTLQSQLEELKQELEEYKSRTESFATTTTELDALKVDCVSTRTALDKMTALHHEDETRVKELESQTVVLEKDLQAMTENYERLKGERHQLESDLTIRVETLNRTSQEKLEEVLANARERHTTMEKAFERKVVENQALELSLQEQQHHAEQITEELTVLRLKVTDHETELANLKSLNVVQLDETQATVRTLTTELDIVKRRASNLEAEKRHALHELSLKEEALMCVKDERDALQRDLDVSQKDVDTCQAECTLLKAELQQIKAEAAEIQLEVEQSAQEYKARELRRQEEEETWETRLKAVSESCLVKEKAYEEEVAAYDIKCRALETEKSRLGQQIEDLTNETARASAERITELKALQGEYDSMKDRLQEEEHAKNETQSKFIESSAALETMQSEAVKHTEQLNSAQASCEQLRSDFARSQAQLETQILELEQNLRCERETRHTETELSCKEEERLNSELLSLKRHLDEVLEKQKHCEADFVRERSALQLSLNKATEDNVALSTRSASLENQLSQMQSQVQKRAEAKAQMSIQTLTLAELNVLTVPSADTEGADHEDLVLPPSVFTIDREPNAMMDQEDAKLLKRGPSLQSYVEALNLYREKMTARDEKFLTRLNKVRALETHFRQREQSLNDRIKKVNAKESQIFTVVQTMKEREAELKSITSSFEKFRGRLHNSMWDNHSSSFMNKTLERPDTEEETELKLSTASQLKTEEDSSPTFMSTIQAYEADENTRTKPCFGEGTTTPTADLRTLSQIWDALIVKLSTFTFYSSPVPLFTHTNDDDDVIEESKPLTSDKCDPANLSQQKRRFRRTKPDRNILPSTHHDVDRYGIKRGIWRGHRIGLPSRHHPTINDCHDEYQGCNPCRIVRRRRKKSRRDNQQAHQNVLVAYDGLVYASSDEGLHHSSIVTLNDAKTTPSNDSTDDEKPFFTCS